MDVRHVAKRMLLFGGLWLVLTGFEIGALPHGAVLTGLATWMSCWLLPPGPRLRIGLRSVLLLPAFLVRAMTGGFDVARRAFAPRLDLDPALVRVPLSHGGGVTVMTAYILSGLPGSLAVDIEDGEIVLHVLAPHMATPEAVAGIERHAAWMMGRMMGRGEAGHG